jgi:DNA-binding FrmR family transcriptional regulator
MNKRAKQTSTKKIIDRLSRAEGQMKALKNSLENEETISCTEFVSQVKAVRNALRAVNDEFIILHLGMCQKLPVTEREREMAEAIKLLVND